MESIHLETVQCGLYRQVVWFLYTGGLCSKFDCVAFNVRINIVKGDGYTDSIVF